MRNKFAVILTALAIVLLSISIPHTVMALELKDKPTAAVVDTADPSGTVPMYSKASTSASVIARYRNGVEVRILDQSGNWSHVSIYTRGGYRAVTGYMLTKALNTDDDALTNAAELPVGVVTYDQGYGLKLRERAESNASPLGEFPLGTVVTVLSKGGDWLHVKVGGITGFMLSKYIQLDDVLMPRPSGPFSYALAATAVSGQSIPVYSGPGDLYLRAANGKAAVGTNEIFYLYKFDKRPVRSFDYVGIRYETSGGAQRIGYIISSSLNLVDWPSDDNPNDNSNEITWLASEAATIVKFATVTDDPLGKGGKLTNIAAGESVTFLGIMVGNGPSWAYIEGYSNGKLFRGFVPESAVYMEHN
ncbi:hypothetical protein FACS1894184_02790 [Clostridia bacterium]|nr:hypothetical protein FACS1894184_02790 [Clostridia bacterium]